MKLVSFVRLRAIVYRVTPPPPLKAAEIAPIGRLVTRIVGR